MSSSGSRKSKTWAFSAMRARWVDFGMTGTLRSMHQRSSTWAGVRPWRCANYVRVQVLTNAGALDRGKQLAVVERLTAIIADAAGDPGLTSRTWTLLTEAPDGGWGLAGHANTNEELVAAARAQLASLAAGKQAGD
jgi:phenylpyruvate tautomerase PptA (4-oxalocrotonate tautomerase family)